MAKPKLSSGKAQLRVENLVVQHSNEIRFDKINGATEPDLSQPEHTHGGSLMGHLLMVNPGSKVVSCLDCLIQYGPQGDFCAE